MQRTIRIRRGFQRSRAERRAAAVAVAFLGENRGARRRTACARGMRRCTIWSQRERGVKSWRNVAQTHAPTRATAHHVRNSPPNGPNANVARPQSAPECRGPLRDREKHGAGTAERQAVRERRGQQHGSGVFSRGRGPLILPPRSLPPRPPRVARPFCPLSRGFDKKIGKIASVGKMAGAMACFWRRNEPHVDALLLQPRATRAARQCDSTRIGDALGHAVRGRGRALHARLSRRAARHRARRHVRAPRRPTLAHCVRSRDGA